MKKIFLVIAIALLTGVTYAQEKELTPQEQQMQIQQVRHMMTQLPYQMKVIMEIQLDVLAKPDTAEKLAQYIKNYYDALVRQGFSKDEALKIAMTVGFPEFPGIPEIQQ